MDKRNALKLAKNYVKFLIARRYYNVKKAFLFGSYARKGFTSDSDIDVALVVEGYKDTVQELSNLMRLRRDFDLRIEPHPIARKDFNNSNPFVLEIKKGLRIL